MLRKAPAASKMPSIESVVEHAELMHSCRRACIQARHRHAHVSFQCRTCAEETNTARRLMSNTRVEKTAADRQNRECSPCQDTGNGLGCRGGWRPFLLFDCYCRCEKMSQRCRGDGVTLIAVGESRIVDSCSRTNWADRQSREMVICSARKDRRARPSPF